MAERKDYDLADAWIEQFQSSESTAESSGDTSAFEQLDDLVRDHPEAAWATIRQLWALDQTDRMLAIIAAGPVEDLLCRHGSDFIDRIEQLAKQDPILKKLLGAVWGRNRMADDVWQRLRAVAGPAF